MSKEPDHSIPYELCSKYLSGNAEAAEVQQLEAWVASSADHREQFLAFKRAWILAGTTGETLNMEVDQEWENLSEGLFTEAKVATLPRPSKLGRRRVILNMVAAAAVVVLAFVWWFVTLNRTAAMDLAAQEEVLEGQLPDGSQVALNRGAELQYRQGDQGKQRLVDLRGDAFFEVQRDAARPFVIRTQEVLVEVLGTAFYVDSRENQVTIKVVVSSGKVAMRAGDQQVELRAGATGVYDKNTGQLQVQEQEDPNYLAWKTGVLTFSNQTLAEVATALERQFAIRVLFQQPNLRSCKITATFEHKSLDAIVKVIEKTLNLEATISGKTLQFSGEGCN